MNKAILFSALMLSSMATYAAPPSDALTTCIADNTSGKDRKELARWVFISMAVHPDIQDITNVSDAEREKSNKTMADLLMRLLTESCVSQARVALQQNNNGGLASSFKTLGELAMKELMTNQTVSSSIGGYMKFVDRDKLTSSLTKK